MALNFCIMHKNNDSHQNNEKTKNKTNQPNKQTKKNPGVMSQAYNTTDAEVRALGV